MIPKIDHRLKCASALSQQDTLTVDTGRLARTWEWTGKGFATVSLTNETGMIWDSGSAECDWEMPNQAAAGAAELVSLTAETGDDEGFTSEHICVTAEIDYPENGYVIRYLIWVYPDSPGIRTQLLIRKTGEHEEQSVKSLYARVDRIPLGGASQQRRYFGYYSDTQNRNDTDFSILKETVRSCPLKTIEVNTWASAAMSEHSGGGAAMVKESHKCVNQHGHMCGEFICTEQDGLANTGWGVLPHEVSTEEFTPAWASWCIVWSGGDLARETAFKQFDRIRYPIDPERDIYIQANTWGSCCTGLCSRGAAEEKSVLEEIDICADMGIDILQIDDGWQVPPGHHTWKPGENGWNPHPESYPEGWQNVKTRAAEKGVKLGLWAAAEEVGLDELKKNYEDGGFVQYKLDFAHLNKKVSIDSLMKKVRTFIKWTGRKTRVNWDLTEIVSRYGYFFAREYGPLYLENRKPVEPVNARYRPHTVLSDLWHLSKYITLHRFQGVVQNVDMVSRVNSDAYLHSHSYATAISLMCIPLFFLETKKYSKAAREEIKPLLAVYKAHRELIYSGLVYPIGNRPDNASWTGFQSHRAEDNAGYLIIFRERCNDEPEAEIALRFAENREVAFTDLMSGESRSVKAGAGGSVLFVIDNAPGFKFLKYLSMGMNR